MWPIEWHHCLEGHFHLLFETFITTIARKTQSEFTNIKSLCGS